jgi:hypothetical protein
MTDADSESARCKPGGLSVFAIHPSEKEWRVMRAPQRPASAGADDIPLLGTAIGFASGKAIFQVGSSDGTLILIYDVRDEKAVWVTQPEDAGFVCQAGDSVVAVATGSATRHFESSTTDSSLAEPLGTYTLEPDRGSWSKRIDTPKPVIANATSERVYCSAGQTVYVQESVDPRRASLLWYETEGWQRLPELPELLGSPLPAKIAGARLLWLDGRPSIFVLEEGQTEWTSVSNPQPGLVGVQALRNMLLIDPTWDQRPPAALSIGLLDPTSYLSKGAG